MTPSSPLRDPCIASSPTSSLHHPAHGVHTPLRTQCDWGRGLAGANRWSANANAMRAPPEDAGARLFAREQTWEAGGHAEGHPCGMEGATRGIRDVWWLWTFPVGDRVVDQVVPVIWGSEVPKLKALAKGAQISDIKGQRIQV